MVNKKFQQETIECKKNEAKIRLHNDALEATVHPIMITDLEGTIEWCNEAFIMMTGYSKEKIIGNNPRMLKSGKHDLKFYKDLWQTIKSGQVWRGEMINRRKDGTLYPEDQTITPLKDQNSNITHFVAIKQDVTERKLAEEKLRVSERKYKGLAESLSQLVYCANPNTFETTYVNSAIKKIYGYTAEEWLKDSDLWEKTIHPDDRGRVITRFTEAQKKVGDNLLEYRIIKKDGSIRQVEDHFTWEKDGQGRFISLNGVMYDITERKQAEEIIRKFNEELEQKIEDRTKNLSLFKKLINQSNDAIFVIDPETGRFLDVNNKVSENLGYSRKELLNMKAKDIGATIYDDQSWQKLVKKIRLNDSMFIQGEQRRKDGTVFPIEINSKIIKEADGEYLVVVSRDITERKKAEKALKNSKLNLEQKNIALNEIITQIEIEKNKIKESIMSNVDQLIIPNIKKLRKRGTPLDCQLIDLLEKNLEQLTSTFGGKVSKKHLK